MCESCRRDICVKPEKQSKLDQEEKCVNAAILVLVPEWSHFELTWVFLHCTELCSEDLVNVNNFFYASTHMQKGRIFMIDMHLGKVRCKGKNSCRSLMFSYWVSSDAKTMVQN